MASYQFIGGDGKKYGPYSAEQMRDFLSQRRLTPQSQVSADGGPMQPAANFPEIIGGSPGGTAVPAPAPAVSVPPPGAAPAPAPQPQPIPAPGTMPYGQPSAHPARLEEMLKGPAIFMMVLAILSFVGGVIGIGSSALGSSMASSEEEAVLNLIVGVPFNILRIVVNIPILIGAIKMKQGQSYGLAMTAAILCILCDWTCCCLGLGAGIWALVILLKPEVKAVFQSGGISAS